MSDVSADLRAHSRKGAGVLFWFAIAAAVFVNGLLVSRESLWIDEGFTAWLIEHRSFASLIAIMGQTPADDRQYPLYVFYAWAWRNCFGNSEYVLRLANLPFVALYVLTIAYVSSVVLKRRFAWIPLAFAPFVWFYTSEARQYVMLMSLATAALGSVLLLVYGPRRYLNVAIWLAWFSLTLTACSNMLGMLLIPGLTVVLLMTRKNRQALLQSDWRLPTIIFAPLVLLIGCFYISTDTGAAFQTEIKEQSSAFPPIVFLIQNFYEDAGFDGLGPPRNVLRVNPLSLTSGYLPWLSFGIVLFVIAVAMELRTGPDPRSRILFAAWLCALACALIISYATHSRFLGRHLAAAFPLILFSALFFFRARMSLALLATVFIVSDFRMSFLSEYWRDDYKAAVADVIQRSRVHAGTIDFVADWYTPEYYGLALTFFPADPKAQAYSENDFPRLASGISSRNDLTSDVVESLLKEQLTRGRYVYLALSKPDLVDSRYGWRRAISIHQALHVADYRSFSIYVFHIQRKQRAI